MSIPQQSTMLQLQSTYDAFVDNTKCDQCDNQAMRCFVCCTSGCVHLVPLCYDCEIEECYHADGKTGFPYPVWVDRNGKDLDCEGEPLESTLFLGLLKDIEKFAKGLAQDTVCIHCQTVADYLIMCDNFKSECGLPHVSGLCKEHVDDSLVNDGDMISVNPDEECGCKEGGELIEIIDRTGTVIDVATLIH